VKRRREEIWNNLTAYFSRWRPRRDAARAARKQPASAPGRQKARMGTAIAVNQKNQSCSEEVKGRLTFETIQERAKKRDVGCTSAPEREKKNTTGKKQYISAGICPRRGDELTVRRKKRAKWKSSSHKRKKKKKIRKTNQQATFRSPTNETGRSTGGFFHRT